MATEMKLTTCLVEDEKMAREVLQSYLTKYCPEVEIIGQAQDAKEAVELINSQQPQLIFLDVEMPFGNAFDVLQQINYEGFKVIFITAYAHYAIQALNQSASYYILKPIDIDELQLAVQKVWRSYQEPQGISEVKVLLNNLQSSQSQQQIALPTQTGFDLVYLKDLVRLQADGNFTKVFLENGTTHLVCRFLKHFEDTLSLPFMRIHRSHIVNLDKVQSYHKGSGGFVVMDDGYEVEVSPSYKVQLTDYYKMI